MNEKMRDAYQQDGAVLAKNCLDAAQLAACLKAFDWAVANPGPSAFRIFNGSEQESHNDNSNPHAKERLDALMPSLPFGRLFADLWGSKHVWYFAEEVFLKAGGKGGRTPWHQDTSYLPWGGSHWGNAWISFDSVPKKNALEVVRGSHRGVRYDGTTFLNPDDPTEPLHGADAVPFLPRLPAIDAERRRNPDAYDVVSFATEPGDALLLHPGSLHGGAQVDADFPSRRTLVFRFFGDDAVFRPLPQNSASGYATGGGLFRKEMAALTAGDPFRSPTFRQLV